MIWQVLTLVLVLFTSADLVGGDMQLDRGGGVITSDGAEVNAKNDGICIVNDEFCIKCDELCI